MRAGVCVCERPSRGTRLLCIYGPGGHALLPRDWSARPASSRPVFPLAVARLVTGDAALHLRCEGEEGGGKTSVQRGYPFQSHCCVWSHVVVFLMSKHDIYSSFRRHCRSFWCSYFSYSSHIHSLYRRSKRPEIALQQTGLTQKPRLLSPRRNSFYFSEIIYLYFI